MKRVLSKKKSAILKKSILFVLIIFTAVSCQNDKESFITGLSLPDEIILEVDESRNVTISHFPAELPIPKLNWHTSDTKIFIVNNDGEITALNVGEAQLTVKSLELNLTAISNVKVIPIDAQYVIVHPKNISLTIGESHILEAEVLPENTTDKNIIWESSDEKIATVSKHGLIKSIGLGSTIITAKCGTISGQSVVNVNPVEAQSVTLSKKNLSLFIGKTEKLIANILPENTTDKTISWSSDNNEIADVSSDGIISGKKVGYTTITATSGQVSASCKVTVLPFDYSVHLNTPGTLRSQFTSEQIPNIISLTISGKLNSYDFLFIHELKALKKLDISNIENSSMPNLLFKSNMIIEEVILPNELLVIPESLFHASSLVKCNIPPKVEKIERFAFAHSALTDELIIPSSVISIEDYAFSQCEFITGLHFNEGLVSIGRGAFSGITGKKMNQRDLTIPSTVNTIGFQSFMDFKGITGSLKILGKNTIIENGAFAHCTDFDNILDINASTIGEDAFYNCNKFKRLILNEGITIINDGAFRKCSALKGELILPSTLIEIGLFPFYQLSFTGDLILPENLQKIHTQAFQGCSGFDRIYSKNITPPLLSGLHIFPNYKYLGVPIGSKRNYQNAISDKPNYEKWSNFIVIEEIDF